MTVTLRGGYHVHSALSSSWESALLDELDLLRPEVDTQLTRPPSAVDIPVEVAIQLFEAGSTKGLEETVHHARARQLTHAGVRMLIVAAAGRTAAPSSEQVRQQLELAAVLPPFHVHRARDPQDLGGWLSVQVALAARVVAAQGPSPAVSTAPETLIDDARKGATWPRQMI